jgi:hypothetical protein
MIRYKFYNLEHQFKHILLSKNHDNRIRYKFENLEHLLFQFFCTRMFLPFCVTKRSVRTHSEIINMPVMTTIYKQNVESDVTTDQVCIYIYIFSIAIDVYPGDAFLQNFLKMDRSWVRDTIGSNQRL